MTQPGTVPIGGFVVTGQKQTTQLPPGSQNFVPGVEITFVTGYNVTASVFVPYNQYTPAYVQTLITQRVAQLDAVSVLTHSTAT